MSGCVVVIGGPTASGKSELALRIADVEGGEIVCADSRQVYAGLTIAAAAPTGAELARVPHHGYGVLDGAADTMSAGRFVAFADALIADINARGKVAVLVGGTGLYLRAWRFGLDLPRATDAPARDMAALLARQPRAIAADARFLLVEAPQVELELRIRARAERMFRAAIVEESLALRARLPPGHALLQTLGTAEALALADGALGLHDAIARTALRTRQYARRQRTWFKKERWWARPAGLRLSHPRDPR